MTATMTERRETDKEWFARHAETVRQSLGGLTFAHRAAMATTSKAVAGEAEITRYRAPHG